MFPWLALISPVKLVLIISDMSTLIASNNVKYINQSAPGDAILAPNSIVVTNKTVHRITGRFSHVNGTLSHHDFVDFNHFNILKS